MSDLLFNTSFPLAPYGSIRGKVPNENENLEGKTKKCFGLFFNDLNHKPLKRLPFILHLYLPKDTGNKGTTALQRAAVISGSPHGSATGLVSTACERSV